ncbi:MG2 domain-containing protein [Marinitoga aeolica]|uniref:Alpha-2-macroglobulin domain-containing protein n=1 Tax=Marinitoga aeolica TaxID=2809031 RepID=A0ABY8PP17_9BACT|nr:MG2 domain-containing protein [Marinitoga aeolica]WGS64386.1 hypothetical protein JRV97_08390 [Marinitoga aeolica]
MKKLLVFTIFIFSLTNVFSYVYMGNKQLYPGENAVIHGYNENIIEMKVYKIIDPMEIFVQKTRIKDLNKYFLYSKNIRIKNNKYYEKIKKEGVYLFELKGKETTYYNIIIIRKIDFISIYDGKNLKLKVVDLKYGNLSKADVFLIDKNNKTLQYKDISEINVRIYNLKKIIVRKNDSYAVKEFYNQYKIYTDNRIVVITDKPIYKPGDNLHVKIHLFNEKENIYSPAKNEKVTIKLKGPDDLKLFDREISTDEFGGASLDYKLNVELPVGYYSLIVSYGNEEEYHGFYLQNYIKPEYKTFLSADKDYYFSNDIIHFKIKLKYYNEEPVKNAQVAYYIRFYPLNSNNQNMIYHGVSFTNNNGEIHLPIKVKSQDNGYYVLQIVSTDESQRQMEDELSVKVYNGKYLIKTNDYYYQSKLNNKFTIYGTVTDINNNPVSGDIKVEIFDESNNIIKSSINSFEKNFSLPIVLAKEGSYKIKLSYKDSYTYVYTYTSKYYQEEKDIKYAIKNNIIQLINFNGYAYLCGRLLYDEGNILKIPKQTLENNLFVVAFYIDNHKIIKKIKRIDLNQNRNLVFSIKLSKDTYKPKDFVELEIHSNEDAEFSIATVDEAIFALSNDNFDFEKILYPKLYNPEISIDTSDKYFFYNIRATLPISKNALASTKAVNSQKSNTREFFPDTALWLPSVKTKNGYAKITFENPDSITKFRLTVNGVSKNSVGTKTKSYISTKDFYIRPILPKFAIKGDSFEFPVILYNNTKNNIKINYNVNSELNISPKAGVVEIPHNSSKYIKLKLKTSEKGKYSILFDFKKDIVKLNFNVYNNILKRNEKEIVQSNEGSVFEVNTLIKDNIYELLKYPYNCTEQSVSSIFPAVLNGYKNIQNNIFRLYKYQNDDGGWGWWPNDKSNPYLTAYVLELFHYIDNVDKNIIENGLNYLKENILNSRYKGYVWYVLKLYGVEINIKPENAFDLLFLSFYDNNAFKDLKKKIKTINNIAYLEYNDNNYFISPIEINSWLLKLLSEKSEKELSLKVLKYLLLNKWYSTKDKARATIALLDFSDLKFDNLKVIKKDIINKENVDEGIKIEKTLYKNYPIFITQDKNKYLVDAFMPINKNYIPENINILPTNIVEKREDEYIWLYKGKDEKFQIYNKYFEISKGELKVDNTNYGHPYSLRAFKNKIYIHTSKGLFEIISNSKIDENITDFAIYNGNIIILKNNQLIMNNKIIEVNENIYYIDALNGEIYLFGNAMYRLNNKSLEYILPISASRLLGENTYYGVVKFEGNSLPLMNFGKFKISFKTGAHKIFISDILKTRIKFISQIPAYLTFEDPIIGASQILINYNENTIKPSYKFYYNWYNKWNYWYSAYQINKNKISFFSNGFNKGVFDYYWKPTAVGDYMLLHTVGYSMYWSGVYGSSKIFNIHIYDN